MPDNCVRATERWNSPQITSIPTPHVYFEAKVPQQTPVGRRTAHSTAAAARSSRSLARPMFTFRSSPLSSICPRRQPAVDPPAEETVLKARGDASGQIFLWRGPLGPACQPTGPFPVHAALVRGCWQCRRGAFTKHRRRPRRLRRHTVRHGSQVAAHHGPGPGPRRPVRKMCSSSSSSGPGPSSTSAAAAAVVGTGARVNRARGVEAFLDQTSWGEQGGGAEGQRRQTAV